jgi:hypothetical protein
LKRAHIKIPETAASIDEIDDDNKKAYMEKGVEIIIAG